MQRKISEADSAATQRVGLAEQYGPIGPAAILAAVICAARKLDKAETVKKAA